MTAKSINADASTHMTTEGGTHIDGHVDIDGGDFVGRDKIVIKQDSPHEVYGLLNPYLGLRAFEFKDRAIYAGREQSTSDAVEKLVDPINPQKLLFITGPSGSGKSSFAQASLLPKLEEHYQKRGKIVRYAIFRPSSHPLIMLEDALVQLHVAMRFSNGKIVGTPTDQVNVLVIDQFEEALVQSDVTQQQEFFHFLTTLPPFFESQTHIIVTLRADYLKELFALEHLWNIAKDGIELRTMRADELSDAIQRGGITSFV